MDTGVRDLGVACFKANSTWINDRGSKDLSNSTIYAVLNTHADSNEKRQLLRSEKFATFFLNLSN